MAKELIFPVSELLGKPQGAQETATLSIKPNLGKDFKLKSHIKAEMILMAMRGEIHVEIRDIKTSIEETCTRCLKKYAQKIKIPLIEAEFLLNKPETESEEDFFLINKKDLTIDLSEIIRQEILLHFPLIPVCSRGCRGLCSKCGTDLNKGKCKCRPEEKEDRPLAILKQFK